MYLVENESVKPLQQGTDISDAIIETARSSVSFAARGEGNIIGLHVNFIHVDGANMAFDDEIDSLQHTHCIKNCVENYTTWHLAYLE